MTTEKVKCQVCTNVSSGVHFGAFTCEGCKVKPNKINLNKFKLTNIHFLIKKGFFSRSLKEKKFESFKCKNNHLCAMSSSCRDCRFSRCINAGMSADGSKIGRPTNLARFYRNDSSNLNDSAKHSDGDTPKEPVSKRFKSNVVQNKNEQDDNNHYRAATGLVLNPHQTAFLTSENNDLLGFGLNHSDWYSRLNKQLTHIDQMPHHYAYSFTHSYPSFQPIMDPSFNFHFNMNFQAALDKFN